MQHDHFGGEKTPKKKPESGLQQLDAVLVRVKSHLPALQRGTRFLGCSPSPSNRPSIVKLACAQVPGLCTGARPDSAGCSNPR